MQFPPHDQHCTNTAHLLSQVHKLKEQLARQQEQHHEKAQQQQQQQQQTEDKENSKPNLAHPHTNLPVGDLPAKYYPPPGATSAGLDPRMAAAAAAVALSSNTPGALSVRQAAAGASVGHLAGLGGGATDAHTATTGGHAVAGGLLNSGAPSGGAWERSKAAALLALERERDALAAQLEQYSRLDLVHRRQLQEVHAKHAKALQDAQVRV